MRLFLLERASSEPCGCSCRAHTVLLARIPSSASVFDDPIQFWHCSGPENIGLGMSELITITNALETSLPGQESGACAHLACGSLGLCAAVRLNDLIYDGIRSDVRRRQTRVISQPVADWATKHQARQAKLVGDAIRGFGPHQAAGGAAK
jgi:hypothetical protein